MKYKNLKNLLRVGIGVGVSTLALSLSPYLFSSKIFAQPIRNPYFTINVAGKKEQKYFVPKKEWKILHPPDVRPVDDNLAIVQKGEKPIEDIIFGIKYENEKPIYIMKWEEGKEIIFKPSGRDKKLILKNKATLIFIGSKGEKILASYTLGTSAESARRIYGALYEIELRTERLKRKKLEEIVENQKKAIEEIVVNFKKVADKAKEAEVKVREAEEKYKEAEKRAEGYKWGWIYTGIGFGGLAGVLLLRPWRFFKRESGGNPGTKKTLDDRIEKEKKFVDFYNKFGGIKTRAKSSRFGFSYKEALDILKRNDLERFSMEVVKNDEKRRVIINKVIKEYKEGKLTVKDACKKIKEEGKISISGSKFYQLRKKFNKA